jgi:hypothetical protein
MIVALANSAMPAGVAGNSALGQIRFEEKLTSQSHDFDLNWFM